MGYFRLVISPQHVAAIVPCLNEASSIAALVGQVKSLLPLVVVVDDGSTDDTANGAQRAGARILRHERNLGKGAALKTGLRYLCDQGFDAAMLLDGDGQHDPNCIPAFLDRAHSSGADLVVGNRMDRARPMPWLRRWVNQRMSAHLSRLAGLALPDTQCGFRLVNLRAWRSLDLQTRRFEVESEMILAFARAGFRIEFVPTSTRAGERKSHIRPFGDTLRWFCWLRQARLAAPPAKKVSLGEQLPASC